MARHTGPCGCHAYPGRARNGCAPEYLGGTIWRTTVAPLWRADSMPGGTDGTATAGLDFFPRTGRLTFAPGVQSQTFDVPLVDDALNEANETVPLSLFAVTGPATHWPVAGEQVASAAYVFR